MKRYSLPMQKNIGAQRSTAAGTCLLTLAEGEVRGALANGVQCYRGVPYASPPVGDLRFASPQPVEAWRGTRDAIDAGANAPQLVRRAPGIDVEGLVGKGWVQGDDYLTLNIWRPDAAPPGLPIMVFIHGGGFLLGSKDVPVQDGTAFARDGVICVAINYRMGVDGFLPIPGVPTNLGLRDIVAALQWVQANAAAIGGDPANVTAFGESAGAMAIADLMTSPLAARLFRRAIVQSGHGAMTRDIDVAQRLVRKLARRLKITPDLDGFRRVPPGDTLQAVEEVSLPTTRLDLRDAHGREPVFGISRFIPVHGDDVLPRQPLDALRDGAGAAIDLLIGTNAEEMNLYLVPNGIRDRIDGWRATWLLHKAQPRARRVLKAYGLGRGRRAGRALTDALTDLVFRWPARRFAEEHQGRTHVYEFEWRSPAFDGQLGAAHAVDVPFVFDTLAAATGPEGVCGGDPPQELARRIHDLWIEFAKTGALPWASFDRSTRQVYRLEAGTASYEAPMPAAAFLP